MAKISYLPLGTQLALSTLHANIDRWDQWRKELYGALADLAAHAARKEQGLAWPPQETPPEPQDGNEGMSA